VAEELEGLSVEEGIARARSDELIALRAASIPDPLSFIVFSARVLLMKYLDDERLDDVLSVAEALRGARALEPHPLSQMPIGGENLRTVYCVLNERAARFGITEEEVRALREGVDEIKFHEVVHKFVEKARPIVMSAWRRVLSQPAMPLISPLRE